MVRPPFHRLQQRPRASAGFALPIAVGGALLILLSSSSLQLLALQSGARVRQLQQRQQIEDTLASAAMQQIDALQSAASGCLLSLDLVQWDAAAAACGLDGAQLAALQQGQLGQSRYRVVGYRVSASAEAEISQAELELQLQGERPWRAGYRVTLTPAVEQGVRITAVQELGLRGARA
jgi:hypothetical protein